MNSKDLQEQSNLLAMMFDKNQEIIKLNTRVEALEKQLNELSKKEVKDK